eukprot:142031-Ditylum_brightwellii.AAC.3
MGTIWLVTGNLSNSAVHLVAADPCRHQPNRKTICSTTSSAVWLVPGGFDCIMPPHASIAILLGLADVGQLKTGVVLLKWWAFFGTKKVTHDEHNLDWT